MLISKSVCHQGLVRERNEDSLVCNESLGLWVVADGVGGNLHGDVASQLASQAIERRVRQGSELSEAICEAHQVILSAVDSQPSLSNMATTVVACRFDGHQFELSWVGDSRAYLLDASGISQLSSDHNLANKLYLQGAIAESELREHVGQHELTQALGQMTLSRMPRSLGELHEGDFLLLCTDGLSGVLTDDCVYQTVMQAANLDVACESLLAQVLEAGAPDNVTFALIQFQGGDAPLKSSDFKQKKSLSASKIKRPKFISTYRHPFDKKAYMKHLKSRKMLLALILASIIFVVFVI
jgi:protein phosphatase